MNKHIGSSLDSVLMEEKIFEETEAKAIKSVLAITISDQLESGDITKEELACKMGTSKAAVYRLLDPSNTSVTLNSMVKVAGALGKKLQISMG